jgi:hypothetical protein
MAAGVMVEDPAWLGKLDGELRGEPAAVHLAQLGDPEAIVALDETAELTKGTTQPAWPGSMPGSPCR